MFKSDSTWTAEADTTKVAEYIWPLRSRSAGMESAEMIHLQTHTHTHSFKISLISSHIVTLPVWCSLSKGHIIITSLVEVLRIILHNNLIDTVFLNQKVRKLRTLKPKKSWICLNVNSPLGTKRVSTTVRDPLWGAGSISSSLHIKG